MIDALETMIQWLEADLTSVGGRVAGKHRFPGTWTPGQKAVSVHEGQSESELYAPVRVARLEMRIYGANTADIQDVFGAITTLCRTKKRFTVTTSQGTALVHYVKQSSGFSLPFDDDIKMTIGVCFFEAMVAEEAVT